MDWHQLLTHPLAEKLLSFVEQLVIWGFYFSVIFYALEIKKPVKKNIPRFKSDFLTEISYPFINLFFDFFISISLSLLMVEYLLKPYFPNQPLGGFLAIFPFPLKLLLGVILADIAVYAEHRFAHAVLWHFHSIHHSAKEVMWSTAGRVHPINRMTMVLFNAFIFYFLGFDGPYIALGGTIIAVMAMFTHSNINLGFKAPWCYLLISPNYHKWHHALEKEGYNKNFCLMFPFIDLLFGTYHYPHGRLPKGYGVKGGKVPDGLLKQLVYPFMETASTVTKKLK